ncbi:MAG: hypothetical protein Q4D52_05790 [Eubacteriales bacterium]|nr:hypothetical protein [Eubacteriales bacterium]
MAAKQQTTAATVADQSCLNRFESGRAKGDLHYLSGTRRRQIVLVVALAVLILSVFLVGLGLYGQSKNPLTIVAAVLVVPFASSLLRLLLLEKGRVSAERLNTIVSVLKKWRPVTAPTIEKSDRIYGPAVYTFGGRVWPIALLLIEANSIDLIGAKQAETARVLETWLKQNGFSVRVRQLSWEDFHSESEYVENERSEPAYNGSVEQLSDTDTTTEAETVQALYHYLKTLIV